MHLSITVKLCISAKKCESQELSQVEYNCKELWESKVELCINVKRCDINFGTRGGTLKK